jgi:uncharacterized protein YndB with AHSA1/START domain
MATEATENVVAVSRRIDAPASAIFAVLCDPSRHVEIDGAGMLRSAGSQRLSAVGDHFVVEMHNDEMGEYEMTSTVVELEPNRLIGWEPLLTRASRDEDQADIGVPGSQRWSFALTPLTATTTRVTETFDCSRSPERLQRVLRGGQRWLGAMTATLDRLAEIMDGL